ncbi:hypothetical protein [Fibrella forsythiae]|uniref:Uncharacterized protein n=1 Tax=Fibrella forsythiae TaxID=2817061 RepID=A0ABS3JFL8_9BACT|nr:hypothetical protein [Fibrella forsythiae]MBO0948770.1 hypothetical protein [Fibrella forsythiae]
MDHILRNLNYLFTTYPLDFYAYFFLLVPLSVAVYRRGFLTPALLLISYYLCGRFISDTVMLYYSLIPQNNLNLSKVIILVDVLFIGRFYFVSLTGNSFSGRLTVVATTIVFCAALVNYLSDGPLSVGRSGLRLLMVVLALTYFNKILAENQIKKVVLHAAFWVSAGFLFYGAGTLMIAVSADYLQKAPQDVYDVYANMDQMISILFSCLAAVGLWMSKFDQDNYYTGIV